MKKTTYIIMIAAALAASASCTKEGTGDNTAPSDKVKLSLSATVNADDATKICFAGESGNVTYAKWEAGDQLWVRCSTQPAWERGECFKTSADKITPDGQTAVFSGVTRNDGRLCAVFPYQYVREESDNDAVILDVIRSKSLVKDNCAYIANAAAAFSKGGAGSLNMKYLFGAIKFSVKGIGQTLAKVEIIDNNSANALWGACTVKGNYDSGELTSVTMENNDAQRNSLALTSSGGITLGDTPLVFYFIAPAGSFADGFRLKFYNKENEMFKQIISTAANTNRITRGKVTIMPVITLDSEEPTVFSGGSGTEADPYIISSPEDIIDLASKVNTDASYSNYADKWYLQANDIDMQNASISPVGTSANLAFTGHYNGNGRAVINLGTKASAGGASGMFGYAVNAEIRGVVVKKRTNNSGSGIVGGVIGYAENCTVSDCEYTEGTFSSSQAVTGGIIGTQKGGTTDHCTISGATINSTADYAGGIVGELVGNGRIEYCNVLAGAIIKGGNFVGGICGRVQDGSFKACKFKGTSTVNASGNAVGGIVGGTPKSLSGSVIIDNCYFQEASKASAKYNCGGMIGYYYSAANKGIKIINCGMGSGYIEAREGDAGGGTGGDALQGCMAGWLQLSTSSGAYAKILNCFGYISGKGLPISVTLSSPGTGGIVGFISSSASNTVEIAGCCSNVFLNDIWMNGAVFNGGNEVPESSDLQVGAIYGRIENNATTTVRSCYFVSGKGLPLGKKNSNVNYSDNAGYSLDVFEDESTVKNKLNAFVNSYTGSEKLMEWSIYGKKPYIN